MKKEEYEQKMFEAYIATPSQYSWYTKAFDTIGKKDSTLVWYTNIAAMVGGVWYLLYRKELKWALWVLFVMILLGVLLPLKFFLISYLLLTLLIGGYATSLVYQSYTRHSRDITTMFKNEPEKSIGVMEIIGGVNPVAIYAGILTFVSFVLIFMGIFASASTVIAK